MATEASSDVLRIFRNRIRDLKKKLCQKNLSDEFATIAAVIQELESLSESVAGVLEVPVTATAPPTPTSARKAQILMATEASSDVLRIFRNRIRNLKKKLRQKKNLSDESATIAVIQELESLSKSVAGVLEVPVTATAPPTPSVQILTPPPTPGVQIPTPSAPSVTPRSEYDNLKESQRPDRHFSVSKFTLTYYLYPGNIEGIACGTLIHFQSQQETLNAARTLRQFPQFLRPIRIVDRYPEIIVTGDFWVKQILQAEGDADIVAEMALSVYRQVYKMVKKRIDSHDSFPKLKDVFGINKFNEVVFIAAATGGDDLDDNIMELRDFAFELANMLTQINARFKSSTIDDAAVLLNAYCGFIRDIYLPWMKTPMSVEDKHRAQRFALNHPVHYNENKTLRLCNNLRRLCDKNEPKSTNLSHNTGFIDHMQKTGLHLWREDVDASSDQNFKEILHYKQKGQKQGKKAQGAQVPANIAQGTQVPANIAQGAQMQVPTNSIYSHFELPRYVSNSTKHYWHNSAGNKLSRLQVISSLNAILPGFINTLFEAYATAVVDGNYAHGEFDYVCILGKAV